MSRSPPLVVLTDLHLAHEGSGATARAVERLLTAHPGQEIVLGGDVFALSNDPPDRDPVESVCRLLDGYPGLFSALRAHLAGGAALALMAGNHDAALNRSGMREALLARFELNDTAPLSLVPWFVRRGEVHIEHGHLWDPDNAPVHPLAPWSSETEPLGVALTRRFVSPYGAWQFAHAHETTLVEGLSRAYRIFGPRMPRLVFRYFLEAGKICANTLLNAELKDALSAGRKALQREALERGVPEETLRLLEAAPAPTHTKFQPTFLRLYFDRVVAALGVAVGATWAVSRLSPLGLVLAAGSGSYLGFDVRRTGKRYQNRPIHFLREGAQIIRRITDAKLVVFGHTHVAESVDGYSNAGSFGYPHAGLGRPYLVVDPSGSAEHKNL